MRARSASRLTLVPRPPPDVPPEAPPPGSGAPPEHLAPPHRATRLLPPLSEQGLGTLLSQGLSSAGIGAWKNAREALHCFGRGLGALAHGQLRRGGPQLARGLVRLARGMLDAPLSVGGRMVSGLQTRFGWEPPGCRLGARQLLELRRVFGDSIDYGRVCLKVGPLGLLAIPGRAFVLGNTVYVHALESGALTGGASRPLHLLVRELTRVWQYQHGGTDYTCQTLGWRGFRDDASWREALDAGRGWRELDPEQQVQFLQAAYTRSSYFRVPGHRFVDADSGVDYTPQLEAALQLLRAGEGAP